MPKKLTINEMIYNTITTKITKEPKYKEVLEALGYELVKDHGWSHYDYWGIKMAEDDRVLVISKGCDNKRHLYKTAKNVETKDITKVDFENLIKTNRSATRWWNMRPAETKIQTYKRIKSDIYTSLSICNDYKKRIAEMEEKLANEKRHLEHWETQIVRNKTQLDEIIAEIKN